MRTIIPDEIKDMLLRQRPFLHYVKGKGMVLVDDAPAEIVEMRERTQKWVDDNMYEK